MTSLEAGLSGAGAEQGAGHRGAAPRGRESTRGGAGPAGAQDTTGGGAAAGAASTEVTGAEEAGAREEAAEVSDREAPSQGQSYPLFHHPCLAIYHFQLCL